MSGLVRVLLFGVRSGSGIKHSGLSPSVFGFPNTSLIIGKYCSELRLFHLELWDKIFKDNVQEINKPNTSEPYFTKLQDLKINCEDYIEPLHLNMMKYFMNCDSSELKIFQYVAHLSWLNDDNFVALWSHKTLQR